MSVELRPDGSVRQPGAASLAGSALCLDQAVRNLVAWGLASAAEAVAMASDHPLAALEPALKARGMTLDRGEVEWSKDLNVARIRLGGIERRFGHDLDLDTHATTDA